jgi:hypothetical protein
LYITGTLTEQQKALVTACHGLVAVDPLTGLQRTTTHFGRPNLREQFGEWSRELALESRVGVFYCGNSRLGKQIEMLCKQVNRINSSGTHFSFHQEEFY